MKRLLTILSVLVLGCAVLSGCSNTFNGIGQDMERNGQSMQKQF